jgi:hypothetical protein
MGGGGGKELRSLEDEDDDMVEEKVLLLRVELAEVLAMRLNPRELASALMEEVTVVAIQKGEVS